MRISSFLRGLVAVLLLSAPLRAMAVADSLLLGNSKKNVVGYLTAASGSEKAGFALYYPEGRMQAYRGCRITDVCVNINYLAGMQPVRVFITENLDGEPLCEQTFMPVRNGWAQVRLDTPFDVDGRAVYIGYEVTGLRYITYGTRLVNGEEWVRQKDGAWRRYDDGHSAAMYAVVRGEALPANDVHLGHVVMPGYVCAGGRLRYTGSFFNLGMTPVGSVQLSFHSGSGLLGVSTLDGLNVQPRTAGSFALDGPVVDTEGDHDFWIEVSAVNGEADAAPYDNSSRHKPLVCRSEFVPRKVLLEAFSTELCTSCPAGHKSIALALGDKTDVVEIGHHAGFYEDGLTISESKDYEWFYRSDNLYAPAVMVDRTAWADNYPTLYSDSIPVMQVSIEALKTVHAEASAVPAFVSVEMMAELDAGKRMLGLHVSGGSLLETDAANPRLFVYLTEDSVFSMTQAGASGSFYHRFVARRSLTPVWGMPVSPADGYTADYVVEIPGEWNMDKMYAVAFVANYDATDKSNCRVLNVEEVSLKGLMATSVAAVRGDGGRLPLIAFDGGRVVAPLGYDRLTVCDMSGRCVAALAGGVGKTELPPLPAGVYVVSVRKGDESARLRVISR